MRRTVLLVTVLLLAFPLFAFGCKTTRNVSPPAIPVPHGLKPNEVELAILLAIGEPREQPELTPGQEITDNLLQSLVWSYRSVSEPGKAWFFEDREPGAVFAGYSEPPYYMRIKIHFTVEEVTLQIVDSRNLKQSATRIHAGALVRLEPLDIRIRQSLGKVARYQLP